MAADAVAIVSGGSIGIGREVARRLAGLSFAIVVVYRDDQRRAERTVEEILGASSAAVAVRADLTDDLDVERLFTETLAVFGGVDVIVHTTTVGAPLLYRYAARYLRRGGTIVSVLTAGGIPAALLQELCDQDITVNGVPPGLEHPGPVHDLTGLIEFVDAWRRRPD